MLGKKYDLTGTIYNTQVFLHLQIYFEWHLITVLQGNTLNWFCIKPASAVLIIGNNIYNFAQGFLKYSFVFIIIHQTNIATKQSKGLGK